MLSRVVVCACVVALASASAFVDGCGSFGAAASGDEQPDAAVPADAGTTDATTTSEGGGGGEIDASGRAPCGGSVFCADFEKGAPSEGWNAFVTIGGGTLVTTPGPTGQALLSTVPARTSGEGSAYVVASFAGATGLQVEFDVNVAPTASSGEFNIVQVSGSKGEAGAILVFRNMSPQLGFYLDPGTGAPADDPQALVEMPRNAWLHVQIILTFGPAGHLVVRSGAEKAYDAPFASKEPPVPSVRLGLGRYNSATPNLSAQYDNVRVDRLP
jgi:hypothetical protein